MSENLNPYASNSQADLWADEYNNGGIPSSIRTKPSGVVVDFLNFLHKNNFQMRTALDIGCGTGRNAIFMAQNGANICAVDYVEDKVKALNTLSEKNPTLNIIAKVANVGHTWPWPDNTFDICIDTYCFKHQIEEEAINTYINELYRCLKPNGHFMLYLAMDDDGYYKQFPTSIQYGIGKIIIDPGNKIASRLYTQQEVEILFSKLKAVFFSEKNARNEMHGKSYSRTSGIWYFKKE